MSVLNFLTLGSSLSARAFAQVSGHASVLDYLFVGSTFSMRAALAA